MIWPIFWICFLAFFAGLLQGGREAYHADDEVFEKWFGVKENSWWGSMSWIRKYDLEGKEMVYHTPFSDYWHAAKWLHKGMLIAASVLSCYHMVYHIFWLGLGIYVIETIGQNVSYRLLRYGKLI